MTSKPRNLNEAANDVGHALGNLRDEIVKAMRDRDLVTEVVKKLRLREMSQWIDERLGRKRQSDSQQPGKTGK